jgi:hypothetical protein
MLEPADYCRQVETYLCRKNEGHLIRIVGPAFEQVCGWAAQGVPLAVAFRGIDRFCERYYAKGPRRRPVRIEFCEADILELFDDWRRAIGVTGPRSTGEGGASDEAARKDTLPAHLERIVTRVTALRAGGRTSEGFQRLVDETVRELDRMRTPAKQARGDARRALIDRLGELDRLLVSACVAELDAARAAVVRAEAEAEIAPFASRMSGDARRHAIDVAFARLVREEVGLPIVAFE